MREPWEDDETKPTAVVPEVVESEETPLEIIKRKAGDLSTRIKGLVITNNKQSEETKECIVTFSSYEAEAKKEMNAKLDPHKQAQKDIKAEYEKFLSMCEDNRLFLERVVKDYTLLEEERLSGETRTAQEADDKKKADAAQTFLDNQKAGVKTPKETLKVMQAPAVKSVALETTRSGKGTVGTRKVRVWAIFLEDGDDRGVKQEGGPFDGNTIWNKTSRLPIADIKGRSGPAIPYVMVDKVAIQKDFDEEKELPHWIHVGDDIQLNKRAKK